MIETWFRSDEFIHGACVLMIDWKGDSDDLRYFLVLQIIMTSRSCKNHLDCFCYICSEYNRLCMKIVLCTFWNKTRRPRQIMGSWCCLQDMCRTFEIMGKWNHTVSEIWYTNGLEGADKSRWRLLVTALSYKCSPSAIRPVAIVLKFLFLSLISCLIFSLMTFRRGATWLQRTYWCWWWSRKLCMLFHASIIWPAESEWLDKGP